jgi:hypothetical protein
MAKWFIATPVRFVGKSRFRFAFSLVGAKPPICNRHPSYLIFLVSRSYEKLNDFQSVLRAFILYPRHKSESFPIDTIWILSNRAGGASRSLFWTMPSETEGYKSQSKRN